jgi:hypothetical protein
MRQSLRNRSGRGFLSAWQEGVSEVSHSPSLKQQLLQREGELLLRFAEHYHKLTGIPRRTRRALQRH